CRLHLVALIVVMNRVAERPHLAWIGVPYIGGWRTGNPCSIEPGLFEQRHQRHETAIARAPDSDSIRIDHALVHQIADTAFQVIDISDPVTRAQARPEFPALAPAAGPVAVQDEIAVPPQRLDKAPCRARVTPAPRGADGI